MRRFHTLITHQPEIGVGDWGSLNLSNPAIKKLIALRRIISTAQFIINLSPYTKAFPFYRVGGLSGVLQYFPYSYFLFWRFLYSPGS
jgi:hypothetical protein